MQRQREDIETVRQRETERGRERERQRHRGGGRDRQRDCMSRDEARDNSLSTS